MLYLLMTRLLHAEGSKAESRIKDPVIKKGASIGVNATILPGVVVVKGSLVTKDVLAGVSGS
jgi:acetyltransferase-like isoleucine patch superfamily enzyme